VKAWQDAIQAVAKTSAPSQETNKLGFQGTVAKLAAKYPTTAAALDKSLEAGRKDGTITAQEYADAKAYQAANPNASTTFNIHEGEAANAAARKNAGAYYTYTDDEGTHLVTGDKVPAGADANVVKNQEQFMGEARAANIVQQSLNQLHKDVIDHPEIFDDHGLRNILSTATEGVDRTAASMLIAGTGGSIPLPSGIGHMIDTWLENNTNNKAGGEALRQYIADYKGAKDKALVMQMEMQGGKIGRAGAQGFKAITDQLPNGATPDSTTARRQLDNLQRTQNELASKYPDKHGSYTKEKPYESSGDRGNGNNSNTPAGAPRQSFADWKKNQQGR
jgi:hypothetical protein